MADPREKREYNLARRRALQELARRHPAEYEKLVEKYLGRPLKHWGRTVTDRLNRGEYR